MTRLVDRAEPQLGVLDELPEDDGRQRFGPELAAGDRAAEVGQAHAPLDERGDAVGLFERDVEGRPGRRRPRRRRARRRRWA